MGVSKILGTLGLDSHIQALTAGYVYPAGAKSPKILDAPHDFGNFILAEV